MSMDTLIVEIYATALTVTNESFKKVKNSSTCELINSTEQSSSWEDNNLSTSLEIPCLLWNPKAHYCVHRSLQLYLIHNHMNPVHTVTPYFSKIHFNIILPCLCFPSVLFHSCFWPKLCMHFLSLLHVCYMP